MRAVQDLAEWTLDDEENSFSEDGKQNMSPLLRRTFRLNPLHKDLLEYAWVGKETDNFIPVSIQRIVAETAALVDPERHFKIIYRGPDAVAMTFATPMRQILLNLISNAIKHHDKRAGEIWVDKRFEGRHLICTAADDSPGIPPKYHDRIFGLFQTLRPRDDVEGSGIGLAIIHKLLTFHDGPIKVVSDPDIARGADFEFHLPGKTHHPAEINQGA